MKLIDSLSFILQSFTIVLPVFLAGLVLIWILRRKYFQILDTPIDRGIHLRGRQVFGRNKTWRGIATYLVITTVICILFWFAEPYFAWFMHPVFSLNPLMTGFVFSMSYVAGELINSFVKRQLNIAPGHSSGHKVQRLFDNVDGILLVAIALYVLLDVSASFLLVAAAIGVALHKSTDAFMVRVGLK